MSFCVIERASKILNRYSEFMKRKNRRCQTRRETESSFRKTFTVAATKAQVAFTKNKGILVENKDYGEDWGFEDPEGKY